MNRLPIIKKLSWIAFYLSVGEVVMELLMIVIVPMISVFGIKIDKLSTMAIVFLIIGTCGKLPFTGICLWNALRKQSNKNQSILILILAPIALWFITGIIGRILEPFAVRWVGTAEYGNMNIIRIAQNYLNFVPWQATALILVCCAMSIELYIFANKESET